MRRSRPPHDRNSAPGDLPGAESFAHAGEPSGIVRLSDLVGSGPVSTPAGAASGPARRARPAARPATLARGKTAAARIESDPPGATNGDAGPPRASCPDDVPSAAGLALRRRIAGEQEPSSVPADAPAGDSGDESLFGPDADIRRRPRRERKPATAMQRALGLLTRREHSRKELTRKLVSRGVDATDVESAVGRLAEAGWQDDRRFAESLVRSRAASGYGPLHIRAELATHDLPSDLRRAVLEEFDGDWLEIARDLVERRFGRLEDRRTRERKAADYLIRRGFPGDIVRSVVRYPSDD